MSHRYDPNGKPRTPKNARRALRKLLLRPPVPTLRLPSQRAWYRLYTRRICRYLLAHLTDEELLDWELPFTVLHELVAEAFALRPYDPDALREHDAWAALSAWDHLAVAASITLLPPDIRLCAFVPHMRGFLRSLLADGAMSEDCWQRLDLEYASMDPTEVERAVA